MTRALICIAIMLLAGASAAQSLYKYKDANGHWQFTDRPPAERDAATTVERDELASAQSKPTVKLSRLVTADGVQIIASNTFHCPVQLVFELRDARNVVAEALQTQSTVLAPDSRTTVMDVAAEGPGESSFSVAFRYLPGDPEARHAPSEPYRLPFAVGNEVLITQAFPMQITHSNAASQHAVDVAVPVGTAIYASRAGTVFDIAYDSYSGGTATSDMAKANVVRIVHADGSMAVYAHLAWNSIRVRRGQRVRRGEYIADSGNTGFSSGPHLHFAVQLNEGENIVSVPVAFAGPGGAAVAPASGTRITAY